jgi:hypothetical protein
MRVLRAAMSGVLSLVLLAGSASGVVAQNEAPDLMAPAYFTFSEPVWEPSMIEEEESPGEWAAEWRGLVETGTIEATDPRASGRVISIANANQLEVDGGGLAIGAARMRLVNDGGAWAGTSQGLHIVAEGGGAMEIAILTGEGGYERLTLIMVQYADDDAQTRRGVILPSDRLPPVPEAIDLPTE